MSAPPSSLSWMTRAVTIAVLVILSGTLFLETASQINARLVSLGDRIWADEGYALNLRRDPEPPLCNLDDAKKKLDTCVQPTTVPTKPRPTDGVEDPFGTPPSGDGVEDPFGTPDASGEVEDPFGEPPDAGVANPFGEEKAAEPGIPCPQAQAAVDYCEQEFKTYDARTDAITPSVRAFRSFELLFSEVAGFPYRKELLSIVLLLGGLVVTARRGHIALRKPRGLTESRTSQAAQLLSHLLLAYSAFANWQVQSQLTVESSNPTLPVIWMIGFSLVAAVNVFHLVRPPALTDESTPTRALLSIPLYAFMTLGSGFYFLFIEGHPSGQAIYLYKFMQYPTIYLAVALYVWAGMMLELSSAAHKSFNVLRPWQMTPMLLGWLVVILAAVPTAYSGASGIFVIAAGAIVFEELRRAGATKQQALMFTAMSGSLGVVLRPCLVVVLIAALNKEVTTDQLFNKGFWVFLLTAAVFLVTIMILNREPLRLRSPREAMPESIQALRGLLGYVLIGGGVLAGYYFLLDTPLNEQTAPQLLPVIMLAILLWEFRYSGEEKDNPNLGQGLVRATGESSEHIGALLFLMCASVCLGGVVERAEVMSLVPESFGSRPVTMGVLVVIMVLVGMTMDAMGAVILVSITVATIAYNNDIDPVHFWMMVLVAFELGYLTPPVSLNHLLARQVIGDEAEIKEDEHTGFWSRYEHIIVPMIVMGVSLLLVAFVPLLWY
ncbi:MAG: TRAP transporter large permease subunit [Myxococcota bacterium]